MLQRGSPPSPRACYLFDMRRREFITFVGVALVWPRAAGAQQPSSAGRRLGILLGTSAEAFKSGGMQEALTNGMKEYGWIEGQNIVLEYRFGNADVLPNLAIELVQLPVDAILTDGSAARQSALLNDAYEWPGR